MIKVVEGRGGVVMNSVMRRLINRAPGKDWDEYE